MTPRSFIVGEEIWVSLSDSKLKVSSWLADLLLFAPNVHSYSPREWPVGLSVRLLDGRELFYDRDTKLSFDARGNLADGSDLEVPSELISGVAELFQIDGADFVADTERQAWKYTGPLEDLQDWFLEEFKGTEISATDGSAKIITDGQFRLSDGADSRSFEVYSYADDLEAAWRIHLGEILVEETEPYSILAADGQSLTELKKILEDFESDLADHMGAGNEAETALKERWRAEVIADREVIGFRPWVRALRVRGPLDESPAVPSLDSPSLDDILARNKKFYAIDPTPFAMDYSPKPIGGAVAEQPDPIDLWGDQDE